MRFKQKTLGDEPHLYSRKYQFTHFICLENLREICEKKPVKNIVSSNPLIILSLIQHPNMHAHYNTIYNSILKRIQSTELPHSYCHKSFSHNRFSALDAIFAVEKSCGMDQPTHTHTHSLGIYAPLVTTSPASETSSLPEEECEHCVAHVD